MHLLFNIEIMNMNYFLIIVFFSKLLFASDSKQNEIKLFDYCWQENNEGLTVYFAQLSELQNPKRLEESNLDFKGFLEKCRVGESHSMRAYQDRKKVIYYCSLDERIIKDFIAQERAIYIQALSEIARRMKAGEALDFSNMGQAGADCCMKASVCPEWDRKSPLTLGYAIKSLAEKDKNGIFLIEGCEVKVIHFDDQGNVDHSKN